MPVPQQKKTGKPQTKMEFAAGGVVYQRTWRGPFIAFILDPYRKWTFAKGHIEKAEPVADAARRETEEEMGLHRLRVIAPLGKTDLWFYERFRHGKRVYGPRTLIHKPIQYFLMEAPRGMRSTPQRSEKIHAVRWVPTHEALGVLSYRNTRPILEKAIALIEKRERTLPQKQGV